MLRGKTLCRIISLLIISNFYGCGDSNDNTRQEKYNSESSEYDLSHLEGFEAEESGDYSLDGNVDGNSSEIRMAKEHAKKAGQKDRADSDTSQEMEASEFNLRQEYLVHRVVRGNTLSGLASRYNTTVKSIKRLNNLRSSRIKIGQRLKIKQLEIIEDEDDSKIPKLNLNFSRSDELRRTLWGTSKKLRATYLWSLGNKNNVKHIWFVNHGDHHEYRRNGTKVDRNRLRGELAKNNEGAILVYPISRYYEWNKIRHKRRLRSYGKMLVKMYRQIEKAVGVDDLKFQTFSLSGSGRLDLALQTYIMDEYDAEDNKLDIKELVDEHLTGMHCGDAMVTYDLAKPTDLTNSWTKFLTRFPHIKASFVHSLTDTFFYMYKKMEVIAKNLTENEQFKLPYKGRRSILNGRVNFWFGSNHLRSWQRQFKRSFYGPNIPPEENNLADTAHMMLTKSE